MLKNTVRNYKSNTKLTLYVRPLSKKFPIKLNFQKKIYIAYIVFKICTLLAYALAFSDIPSSVLKVKHERTWLEIPNASKELKKRKLYSFFISLFPVCNPQGMIFITS